MRARAPNLPSLLRELPSEVMMRAPTQQNESSAVTRVEWLQQSDSRPRYRKPGAERGDEYLGN